jgi:hypothetical protein
MVLNPSMKFFLGSIFTLLVFTVVIGGGGLIWYLSETSELTRKEATPAFKARPLQAVPVTPLREPGRR